MGRRQQNAPLSAQTVVRWYGSRVHNYSIECHLGGRRSDYKLQKCPFFGRKCFESVGFNWGVEIQMMMMKKQDQIQIVHRVSPKHMRAVFIF